MALFACASWAHRLTVLSERPGWQRNTTWERQRTYTLSTTFSLHITENIHTLYHLHKTLVEDKRRSDVEQTDCEPLKCATKPNGHHAKHVGGGE